MITLLDIGDYAFSENTLLSSIAIPSTTASIGDYAFYRCNNVSSLTFGTTAVTPLSIGAYAFAEIHYLYNVTLPGSVCSLGEGVFAQNTRLKYVEFAAEKNAGVTSPAIPDYAFVGATNMIDIVVPAYFTGVGAYAFKNTSLREVTFLGEATNDDFVIGEGAFAGLTGLTSVVFPDNLTEIGEKAFYQTSLSEYDYNETGSDLTIGPRAFADTMLTTFTANKRVVALGEGAFRNIITLNEFIITDDGLTAIPAEAFYGAESLTHVELGHVSSIGARAFYNTGVTELISSYVRTVGSNAYTMSMLGNVVLQTSESLEIEASSSGTAPSSIWGWSAFLQKL